jgi:hypothetical protein
MIRDSNFKLCFQKRSRCKPPHAAELRITWVDSWKLLDWAVERRGHHGNSRNVLVGYRSVTNVSGDVHPCPRNVPLRHQRNREKLWLFGYHGNQKGWLT